MLAAARVGIRKGAGGPISDTFNRSDSPSSLGTTSDGAGVWVVPGPVPNGGTWGISSNQAYSPTNGTVASGGLALIDCLSGNGTVTVTIAVEGAAHGVGPAFRFDAAGTNGFYVTDVGLARVDSSSAAIIAAFTYTAPARIAVTLNGSAITVQNLTTASTLCSITDANYVSNSLHGLATSTSGTRFDDWSFT